MKKTVEILLRMKNYDITSETDLRDDILEFIYEYELENKITWREIHKLEKSINRSINSNNFLFDNKKLKEKFWLWWFWNDDIADEVFHILKWKNTQKIQNFITEEVLEKNDNLDFWEIQKFLYSVYKLDEIWNPKRYSSANYVRKPRWWHFWLKFDKKKTRKFKIIWFFAFIAEAYWIYYSSNMYDLAYALPFLVIGFTFFTYKIMAYFRLKVGRCKIIDIQNTVWRESNKWDKYVAKAKVWNRVFFVSIYSQYELRIGEVVRILHNSNFSSVGIIRYHYISLFACFILFLLNIYYLLYVL